MNLFKKIIERLVSPLGLALVSFAILILCLPKSSRKLRLVAWFGFLVLLVPSTPVATSLLLRHLEDFAPAVELEALPPGAAIVVLGGTVAPQPSDQLQAEEIGGSRLLTALRLYRLKKGPKIVVSSGISYIADGGGRRTEARDMKEILVSMGVPDGDIILEDRSINTQENAQYSAEVLRTQGIEPRVLLVSSALHMRRATFWFERAGINATPVGAGRLLRNVSVGPMDFFPSAGAFARSAAAFKEYLGFAVARVLNR